MLHNNYTQQDYKSFHVILPASKEGHRGALLLGDLNAATDQQALEENGVRTIITAAAGLEHLEIAAEYTHVVFPLLDVKHQNIDAYFELSYQTIEENLKRGGVLVHCGAGVSRSATLVIAYYMKKFDSTFANALKYVRKIRSSVCPNLGFELQLKKYQEKLHSDKVTRQGHLPKEPSQHEDNIGRGQMEAKQMLLTFNAPNKQSKDHRMTATNTRTFSRQTPLVGRKGVHHGSGQKWTKTEQQQRFGGGLFVEGRAAGEAKNESLYDPDKYWHRGGARKKEKQSFKA